MLNLSTIFKDHHLIANMRINLIAMELTGIEPATSCLQSRRSPKLSYSPEIFYDICYPSLIMGLGGVEPPTPPLSGACSNHLSHKPK